MNVHFEEKYFCAANTGEGFLSYYGELISSADRVFIIKGGPGTGKSRFLREVAKSAEKHGKSVVYYYCSSDPLSLDAVLIDKKTLLLDGTAPHSVETAVPGARDSIIDLGAFWDSASLIGERKRIKYLADRKATCFKRAYMYLSAAKQASFALGTLTEPAVLYTKLKAAAKRVLKGVSDGEEYIENTVVQNSYGMRGNIRFDTLGRNAGMKYAVAEHLDTACLFLSEIIEVAKEKHLTVSVSRDPLIPERVDAVYIESADLLFYVGSEGDKIINMKRFLDEAELRAARQELKYAVNLKKSCIECALTSLSKASEYHFSLEKIYGEAMDFSAKEEFTDNFISEMFD